MWKIVVIAGELHVIPVDDTVEHYPDVDCWCDPGQDIEYPEVVVHNSADGREHYEYRSRKPH